MKDESHVIIHDVRRSDVARAFYVRLHIVQFDDWKSLDLHTLPIKDSESLNGQRLCTVIFTDKHQRCRRHFQQMRGDGCVVERREREGDVT